MNIDVQLSESLLSVLWGINLEVGIIGLYGNSVFKFLRNFSLFSFLLLEDSTNLYS